MIKDSHPDEEANKYVYNKSRKTRTVLDSKFRLEVPHDDESKNQEILIPFKYLTAVKGKNFRNELLSVLNNWYDCPEEIVIMIGKNISIIHTFSLLLDDIQDNSILRRGSPCAHLLYGVPQVINTSTFLQSSLNCELINLYSPELAYAYLNIISDAFRGQAIEMYWRDNSICPTEEEYNLMVVRKTGCIFLLIVRWLKQYSSEGIDGTALAEALALYFQIYDDYKSLNDISFQEKKGFCEDISEGKFGFPIIYVVNNFPEEGRVVLDILKQRTRDIEVLKYCRSIIEISGGLKYTKQTLKKYKEIAIRESQKLGQNSLFKTKILDGLMAAVTV